MPKVRNHSAGTVTNISFLRNSIIFSDFSDRLPDVSSDVRIFFGRIALKKGGEDLVDLITHALLGVAIAPDENLALPMAISSTIPDWWVIPPLAEYLITHRGRFRNQEFWEWIPPRYVEFTRWSHSLVPLILAFAIGTWIFTISPWVFLPWLLHLIIDIPTHARSRTGYPLYPWSRWQPLGARNWYEMWWFSIVAIVVLGTVVVIRFMP